MKDQVGWVWIIAATGNLFGLWQMGTLWLETVLIGNIVDLVLLTIWAGVAE